MKTSVYSSKIVGLILLILLSFWIGCNKEDFPSPIEDNTDKELVNRLFGGTGSEYPLGSIELSNNDILIVGRSTSKNGDFEGKGFGGNDIFLIRIDKEGNKIWGKTFGGEGNDFAHSIIEIDNQQIIIVGNSSSKNFDLEGQNNGNHDIWILKLDRNGNIIWDKTFGTEGDDFSYSASKTSSNEIQIIGSKSKNLKSQANGTIGDKDLWFLKIDVDGNIILDKTLIDNEYQFGSNYPGQHVLNFNNENFVLTLKKDINLLKINTNGSILWERPIIDNEDNYTANNIISTDENIYVIGNHRDNNFDVLILKLDNEGNVIWERTFGGSDYDDVFSIVEVNNFLYLVGVSYSFDGGAISDGNNGKEDLLVLKIDKEGNVIWDRTLGGSNSDGSFSILQSNENIWITGFTESNDFDIKSQNKGGSDLWIIRLNQSGEFN